MAMDDHTRGGVVYAARIGYAAEGVVYGVLGILALLAAFGESDGRLTDTKGAVETIGQQPFGAFLLWATAVGLACYALWNGVRAVLDPEHNGSDGKGKLKRVGYGVSCLGHLALAVYAAQLAYGSSHSSSSTQTWVAKLLSYPLGALLIGVVGAIAIVFGAHQVYVAARGEVGEQYAAAPLAPSTKRISHRVAQVGVLARGLVFPVIGISLIVAAWQHDPGEAHGFGEALGEFAGGPLGTWLLIFVAAGLLAYGVHLFFVARYGRLPAPR